MQLLLVEDDAAMQATLQRSLARRGMDVTALADGRAALAHWIARPPDAIVLDLSLPGLDGLQVLQQARARGLRTPVLLLTARGTVGDRVLGLNAGPTTTCPSPSTWTSWKPACAPWCAAAAMRPKPERPPAPSRWAPYAMKKRAARSTGTAR